MKKSRALIGFAMLAVLCLSMTSCGSGCEGLCNKIVECSVFPASYDVCFQFCQSPVDDDDAKAWDCGHGCDTGDLCEEFLGCLYDCYVEYR